MPELNNSDHSLEGIAIIGMAGRFPGAPNVRQFWKNICAGVESITDFNDQELRDAGVDDSLIKNPHYVKRSGSIPGIDLFDAAFFGVNPREAEIMDPQHRLLLECAWEAIEDAGYDPERYEHLIGVYAGNGMNQYLINNLISNPELLKTIGDYQTLIGNANDFLSSRISYKLNLKGPSLTLLTACSTSLVAVHTACQGLLSYQCDMALAGAVSLKIPAGTGYLYKEGHILSPEGRCKAFDVGANGTVWSEGLGIIVLKRLEEAVHDRDTIYAVIKGSAINNDGNAKVGFTAPSVEGQANVIALAQALAGVTPQNISYVEAHGTATPLGDPIEIAGLAKAFHSTDNREKYCALGSVKTNIGHLDAAAGVAGIIKTALALKHHLIPPTLHFKEPNPKLNLDKTPFYVNTTLSLWETKSLPRMAGVSSFGIGGTNAHAVLEEPPKITSIPSQQDVHLLLVSARTGNALEAATENLSVFLQQEAPIDLSDVAFTLQTGRKWFPHRRAIICKNSGEACQAIQSFDLNKIFTGESSGGPRPVVFMFSGQGSQYANMCRNLYDNQPLFREKFDYCCSVLSPLLDIDLKALLFPSKTDSVFLSNLLTQTRYTQPALFALEYSLANLFLSWGIRPSCMIGHSLGEYVAACLSGVFNLDDVLKLIAERGKIMQQQPPGIMLSVSASPERVQPFLEKNLEIALINGPQLCVVGGPQPEIINLEKILAANEIMFRKLETSHAFHTASMDKACEPFERIIASIPRKQVTTPFISNVTGTWISNEQACDPGYWASHIRKPVQFSIGISQILAQFPNAIFVEIGPGNTLCSLVNLQTAHPAILDTVQTVSHSKQSRPDQEMFMSAIGRLWCLGTPVNVRKAYEGEQRFRVALPTYPFERQRFWVEPSKHFIQGAGQESKFNSLRAEDAALPVEPKERKQSVHPRPLLSYEYIAPVTDPEKQLTEIWQKLLGIEPIGVCDNFFDLGGHSLLAVQMFSEIQKATGLNLPLATLFKAPTVRELCVLLDGNNAAQMSSHISGPSEKHGENKNPWKYLVPIKPHGKLVPFFCVHGVGGNVLNYYQLTQHMDSEQPLYGLQCRGLDGIATPFNSVFEMAENYMRELRQVQPHGPYILGGGSMGGLVAFEMAQILAKENEEILQLIMFDSVCLKGLEHPQLPRPEKSLPSNNTRSFIGKVQHSVWCRIRDLTKNLQCSLFRIAKSPIPHELRYWLVEQKNISLAVNYQPMPYKGAITFFRAAGNMDCNDPYRGWKKVALGGMEFFDFDCGHETMVEKIDVAKKLGAILKKQNK